MKRPTPMQTQGLPVALSGRNMVGIVFTGIIRGGGAHAFNW